MDRHEVIAALQTNLHKIVDATKGIEIDETKSMKEYGADSLEIVEVVSRTMKQLNVKIPRTALAKATNLAELVDLFLEHGKPS
jgi:acyl carrier protein